MKKYIIITLFIFLMAVAKVNASTCVKDLNGDGVIDPQTEKWNCLATEPPICPQDIVNCTINNITLSGATSTAQTNITDKIGITKISADAQGASLIIEGWSCSSIACSSASIGSIKIQNATVSGTVAADKISRMVGSGSTIQIFGCDGGTACAEALLGTISIDGASVTGSAAADAGLISIVGSNSTLSIAGMTCNTTGCYQITAGTISISGINASCPLGSQYQCVNVSGVQQCSDLACNDDTFGGTVSPGQQICVKDINGDGYIDFSTEMAICQNYNNQCYCPLLAQNCSLQTSPPVCPPGGSVNATTKNCEITVNNNYTCPATSTVYQDQSSCNANCILTQTIPPTPQYTCPVTNIVYQDQSGCNSNCTQTETINATQNYTCSSSGTVYPDSSTCTTNCHHTVTTAPAANYTCSSTGTVYSDSSTCTSNCNTVTSGTCNGTSGGYICYIGGVYQGSYASKSACLAACKKTTPAACIGPTYTCPPGYTYQNNTCVETVNDPCTGPTYTCPSGYTLQGTTCVKTISIACTGPTYICPTGYTDQNNSCTKTGNDPCTGPTYTCPTGYNIQADNTCTAAPTCTAGTLDNDTLQCVIGYTCPLGSQYNCFPNTANNNAMQCNNIPCVDGSTQNSTPNNPNPSSYHNDGPTDGNGKCLGTIMIFNGKPLECRPPGVNTNFFNCCDQADGSFLMIKKMCGEPDTECVAKAATGSCHFIGDYCKEEWWLVGCVQRANVFCCFNSMLARIIQEQGRPQLQSFNGWGSVGAPDCRGFTEDEFSHLDFSKIDLSEYINATKTAMDNKVQIIQKRMTQQFNNNIQNQTP